MKFTLPKAEKENLEEVAVERYPDDPYEYVRRVSLPVNDEILKATTVGSEVTVTLTGKVCAAEAESNYDGPQVRISVSSVEVDGDNEFTALAEDD